ncbi:AAA family ATPase [Desulfotomaculum copahuensis]|uniref:ATPase n=1 Tax=Desulfotomaculum copahuensis TaxID=1838280 RepID=A0A1B7LH87_9FIRM|nr:MoxR family ATPase [Desulfotomaculum copahuensis]OAT85552.1 ATPase [Desulfotomaculum copahuensis]
MDVFKSIESIISALVKQQYLISRASATTVFLAVRLGKPLLVEGPAGAGKTGLARALAGALNTELVRLQCYPGLDEARALYEWNYQKQLLYIQSRAGEKAGWEKIRQDIYTPEFLLGRPVLRAFLAGRPVVLLIDEVDKSDEELESFLLEALSDFQLSIPELGTVHAGHIPLTVLTSNNSRELSDALKRRCLHLYLPYPGEEQEQAIIALKVPGLDRRLAAQAVEFVHTLRRLPLKKGPSIAETLDWAHALLLLGAEQLDPAVVAGTLDILLKYQQDVELVGEKLAGLLPREKPPEAETPAGRREKPAGKELAVVDEEPGGLSGERDLSRFDF